MNKKQLSKLIEQIGTDEANQALRKERINKAAFMEHKKTCAHCAAHFDAVMQAKAQQEAGEEARNVLSHMSNLATQTLSRNTLH